MAVVAVLKTLGAPKKLASLIEGESLLNDGSAFVLFLIFKDMAAGHDQSVGSIIVTFVQLSLGGPAFGLLCAWVAYFFLYFVCACLRCRGVRADTELTCVLRPPCFCCRQRPTG